MGDSLSHAYDARNDRLLEKFGEATKEYNQLMKVLQNKAVGFMTISQLSKLMSLPVLGHYSDCIQESILVFLRGLVVRSYNVFKD